MALITKTEEESAELVEMSIDEARELIDADIRGCAWRSHSGAAVR